MARVHLHHDWRHRGLERQLHHLMTVREHKAAKQKVCHLDMSIYILRFPGLDFSIWIHMTRISCAINILSQIC